MSEARERMSNNAVNNNYDENRTVVHLPNKVLAMGAKSGLLEEARYEAMILHIVDVLLLQRTLAAAVPQQQFVVGHFLDLFLSHC